MMSAEDLKVFNGKYVEISWFDNGPQGACGVFVGVSEDGEDACLDWGYGVSLDSPQFMMKIVKEPAK
jgi:hypothetical protein